jgi:ABC-type phosphate transport system substrate-binding protein
MRLDFMRKRLPEICLLAVLIAVATAAYATDFAVIVNPSNSTKAMALADLGKIFRGKTSSWPNGRGITLVLRDPSSPSMKFIIEKVMGVSADEGKAELTDANRGKSAAIQFVSSDEDVLKAVAGSSTAIGIIDVYNITGGVKVIKIDDKQPFDPGYVLKGR